MIAVFRDKDMGDQTRARPAAFDRQARHRRLRDPFAIAAAQPRPHMHHDLEVRGHIFQRLALIVADLAQTFGTTGGTGASAGMGDDLARKMVWQRAMVARARRPDPQWRLRTRRRGRLPPRLAGGLRFLEVADRHFEPVDLAVELLGRPAEARAP
jgi:hypothetical protein